MKDCSSNSRLNYGSKRSHFPVKTLLIIAAVTTILSMLWIYAMIPGRTQDDEDLVWKTAEISTSKDAWNIGSLYHQTISKLKNFHSKSHSKRNQQLNETSCKIPKLDPFEFTLMNTTSGKDWKIDCGRSQIFWTDHNWNLFKNKSSKVHLLNCCYRVIFPQTNPSPSSYSNRFTYKHVDPTLLASYTSTCVDIASDVTKIPDSYEYISIECHKKKNLTKTFKNATNQDHDAPNTNPTVDPKKNETIVYRDMFAFVPFKYKFENSKLNVLNLPARMATNQNETASALQVNFLTGNLNQNETKPSILIIGLDQVSHMQFIRHFPKSYEFLTTKLGAKGMQGYNKVADTTLPNVVPLLTGLHLDELSQSCWNHSFLSFFDNCTFIWKNFSSRGYLTSYAEDKMPFSTFYNKLYARRGFRHQPTDYFYNFLGMQIYTEIKSRPYCTNNRLQYEDMLDYIEKTAFSLKNHSYFQFAWASSLFTKEYNLARNGDLPLASTLETLHKNKLLENTILIILSDHGYRFSPLVELKQGRAESRLPLLYAAFPQSFQQKFPKALQNFETNTHRLTTAFDVFETLKDLLDPDVNLPSTQIQKRMGNLKSAPLKRGISLFLNIPLERSCASAGIEENFCSCSETKALKFYDKSDTISKFKKKILEEINGIVNNSSDCLKLKLNKSFRSKAEVVIDNNEENKAVSQNNVTVTGAGDQKYFILYENFPGQFDELVVKQRPQELRTSNGSYRQVVVTIQTVPGFGIFEGRLKFEGRKWHVKDVLRLNAYNQESHCVYLYKLKSFCFCKNQRLNKVLT